VKYVSGNLLINLQWVRMYLTIAINEGIIFKSFEWKVVSQFITDVYSINTKLLYYEEDGKVVKYNKE